MSRSHGLLRAPRLIVCVVLAFVWFSSLATLKLPAQDSIRKTTALRFTPENVSFYSSILKMREQVEAIIHSNAVARLKRALASRGIGLTGDKIEESLEDLDLDVGEVIGSINTWLEENEELSRLLVDMVSHEVFVYGGSEYADIMRAYSDFTSEMYRQMAQAAENDGDVDRDDLDIEKILPPERLKQFNLPDTVVGFKLSDPQRAVTQLGLLKEQLSVWLEDQPMVLELIKSEKIGEGQFLTLTANGSMIPWDEIDEEDLDDNQRRYVEKIKPIVEKKTIAVAVGVLDDYLLISTGDSTKHLESLGKGKLLIDRPELARLREHENRDIVSAAYASEKLAKSAYSFGDYVEDMTTFLAAFLTSSQIELDDMVKGQLKRDLKELAADLSGLVPEPGNVVGFSFRTDKGYEGYTQNWAENLYLDGSKRLSITNHVGGDPIFMFAARGKYKPDFYMTFVKWLKKADMYMAEYGAQQLDEEDRESYENIRKAILPALSKIDTAMSEMYLPAFRDGQTAFVVDAKLDNHQWHFFMPPADKALAIIEPACVYSVSDPSLLKKAVGEITSNLNEIIAKVREVQPDKVPEFAIPPAQKEETDHGELFYYPFLAMLGVDERITPTGALSKEIATIALSRDHAKRILTETPLKADWLTTNYADKPLAMVSHCNWPAFIDVVAGWVEYGVKQKLAFDAGGGEDNGKSLEKTLNMTSAIADLLKCFRGYSSVVFEDGDSLVTHYECRFEDSKN